MPILTKPLVIRGNVGLLAALILRIGMTETIGIEAASTGAEQTQPPKGSFNFEPIETPSPDAAAALSFPEKLHAVLKEASYADIISWNDDGTEFSLQPESFASGILRTHFQGTKFESFTRKLNRWGCKRLAVDKSQTPRRLVYRNELFLRDKPELIRQMSGTGAVHKKRTAEAIAFAYSAMMEASRPAVTPSPLAALTGLAAIQRGSFNQQLPSHLTAPNFTSLSTATPAPKRSRLEGIGMLDQEAQIIQYVEAAILRQESRMAEAIRLLAHRRLMLRQQIMDRSSSSNVNPLQTGSTAFMGVQHNKPRSATELLATSSLSRRMASNDVEALQALHQRILTSG